MAWMSLKDVRRMFCEEYTGRYDLINEDGSDAGADKFIRQAADWLDEMVEHPKSVARYIINVTQGDYYKHVPRLQRVHQVWIMGEDVEGNHKRQRLHYRTLDWLRSEYYEPWDEEDQDTPYYYAVDPIGLAGSQWDWDSADELSGLDDVGDIKEGDHFDYTGILWAPPSDGTYVMTVFGDFYSRKLTTDAALNYWTAVKPLTLAKAAAMQHEASLRNRKGEEDWLASIEVDLRGIDKAQAGKELNETNQMEG